jgi:hypothetical protein
MDGRIYLGDITMRVVRMTTSPEEIKQAQLVQETIDNIAKNVLAPVVHHAVTSTTGAELKKNVSAEVDSNNKENTNDFGLK